MFGWLRDALASAPSSLGYRHPITPSSLFRQQKQKQQDLNSSDDEEINHSNDNSFYHNPYHSSGLMNYVDVPQQQYINEHTYPTYLAQQQTSDTTNQTLDDQIHAKLLSLQQRGNQFQSFKQRQYNDAYRNQILPTRNIDGKNNKTNEEISEEEKDNDELPHFYSNQYRNFDEPVDLASVVLWYRNVMQSVKKFM